ncbi:MAG: hypothetical protein PVH61_44585 [Candidatus Aminicenantes bacterium]|jgi:hypothetical protein
MNGFEKIVPYLKDPLVLIGFFLLLFFSFLRFLLKQKLIPPLTKKLGYKVLKTILLYGFIIGMAIIILGFGLKYRTLSIGEQNNAVELLRQEFKTNFQAVSNLAKNTEIILTLFTTVAKLLRDERIKILPLIFPAENLSLEINQKPANILANEAMDQLASSGLLDDKLELRKVTAAGKTVADTVDKTLNTIVSISDTERKRYAITSAVWKANLPILRKVSVVDVTEFQRAYTDMTNLRNSYDVVANHVVTYLEAVREFFRPKNNTVTRSSLSKVLTVERLSVNILKKYSDDLGQTSKRLSELGNRLAKYSMK